MALPGAPAGPCRVQCEACNGSDFAVRIGERDELIITCARQSCGGWGVVLPVWEEAR